MNFGKITTFVLIGGTKICSDFALELKKMKCDVVLITAPRQLNEKIGELTFQEVLNQEKIKHEVIEDINKSKKLDEYLTSNAIGIYLGPAWDLNENNLNKFKGRLIEFMGIPLPQYRGGAHYTHQILKNDRNWACYLQIVTNEKHKGQVFAEVKYQMPLNAKTPQNCLDILSDLSVTFLVKFAKDIIAGKEFEPKTLQEEDSSYYPFLFTDIHGLIDWNWNYKEVETFINAFDDPYTGASTFIGEKRIHLKKCMLANKDGYFHPFQAGIIYRIKQDKIYIAVKGGAISVNSITDENGKNIIPELKEGDRLYTPTKYIENARTFKATYNSKGINKKN